MGGGPGLGSLAPKKGAAGGPGPSPLGARGGHALRASLHMLIIELALLSISGFN